MHDYFCCNCQVLNIQCSSLKNIFLAILAGDFEMKYNREDIHAT